MILPGPIAPKVNIEPAVHRHAGREGVGHSDPVDDLVAHVLHAQLVGAAAGALAPVVPAAALAHPQVGAVVEQGLGGRAGVVLVVVLARQGADLGGVDQQRARRGVRVGQQHHLEVVAVAVVQPGELPHHDAVPDLDGREGMAAGRIVPPGRVEGGGDGQGLGDAERAHGQVAAVVVVDPIVQIAAGHELAVAPPLVDLQVDAGRAHAALPGGLVVVRRGVVGRVDHRGVGEGIAHVRRRGHRGPHVDRLAAPAGQHGPGHHQLVGAPADLDPAGGAAPPTAQGQRHRQGVGDGDLGAARAAVVARADLEDHVLAGRRVAGPRPFADVELRIAGDHLPAPLGPALPLLTLVIGVAGGDLDRVGDPPARGHRDLGEHRELHPIAGRHRAEGPGHLAAAARVGDAGGVPQVGQPLQGVGDDHVRGGGIPLVAVLHGEDDVAARAHLAALQPLLHPEAGRRRVVDGIDLVARRLSIGHGDVLAGGHVPLVVGIPGAGVDVGAIGNHGIVFVRRAARRAPGMALHIHRPRQQPGCSHRAGDPVGVHVYVTGDLADLDGCSAAVVHGAMHPIARLQVRRPGLPGVIHPGGKTGAAPVGNPRHGRQLSGRFDRAGRVGHRQPDRVADRVFAADPIVGEVDGEDQIRLMHRQQRELAEVAHTRRHGAPCGVQGRVLLAGRAGLRGRLPGACASIPDMERQGVFLVVTPERGIGIGHRDRDRAGEIVAVRRHAALHRSQPEGRDKSLPGRRAVGPARRQDGRVHDQGRALGRGQRRVDGRDQGVLVGAVRDGAAHGEVAEDGVHRGGQGRAGQGRRVCTRGYVALAWMRILWEGVGGQIGNHRPSRKGLRPRQQAEQRQQRDWRNRRGHEEGGGTGTSHGNLLEVGGYGIVP